MHLLLSLLAFAALALAALAAGALLVRGLLGLRDCPLRIAWPLGLGCLSHLLLLLAAASLLRPLPCLLAILALLPGLRLLRGRASAGRSVPPPRPADARRFAACMVAVAAAVLVLCLYPPIHPDSGIYHLPLLRHRATCGDLSPDPTLRFPVFPQLHEMLAAPTFFVGGTVAPHLVQASLFVAAALNLHAVGRRLGGERLGAVAALVWAGSPQTVYVAGSAYVDAGLTAFCVAALHALLRIRPGAGDAARCAALAGLACGFAAGTKYTGLLAACAGALCLLRRGHVAGEGLRGAAARLAPFAAAAALAGAPWYVHGWVAAGDPLFPIGGPWFERAFWNASDLAALGAMYASHGIGRDLAAFALTPLLLVTRPHDFMMTAPYSPLLLGAVLALPGLARRTWIRWSFAACLLAHAGWFLAGPIGRYLVPVTPLLALLAAQGLRSAARRWPALQGLPATVGFALLAALPVAYAGTRIARLGPPPVTAAGVAAFHARHLPTWPAYATLAFLPGRESVYGLFDEEMRMHHEGPFLGDWCGQGRFRDVLARAGDPRAMRAFLHDLGVDHLVVDRTGPALPGRAALGPEHGFRLLLELPDVALYALHARPAVERAVAVGPLPAPSAGAVRPAPGSICELAVEPGLRVEIRMVRAGAPDVCFEVVADRESLRVALPEDLVALHVHPPPRAVTAIELVEQ